MPDNPRTEMKSNIEGWSDKQRFKTALKLGRTASSLERQAGAVRTEARDLVSEPFIAPDGKRILISPKQRESPLRMQIPDDSEPGKWQNVKVDNWENLPSDLKNSTQYAYHMDEVPYFAKSLEFDYELGEIVAYDNSRLCRVIVSFDDEIDRLVEYAV